MSAHRARNSRFRRLASSVVLGVLAVGANGCATLHLPLEIPHANAAATPHDSSDKSTAADAKTAEAQLVQIEFRPASGKPDRKSVKLTDSMFVQDALNQTQALRRYRRSNVEIVRKTPVGNQHKMIVSVDRQKHEVEPQCDYQLQPGDVVIVKEDPSNIVTDMLQSFGGPQGGRVAKQLMGG